jgi:hypothetical protein
MILPALHSQAGLVIHSDGRAEVVVAAGWATNATQVFSVDTQTWRLGSDFPAGTLGGGSSVPYGDTFLVVGGSINGAFGPVQDTIFMYEVETGQWVSLPQRMSVARVEFAAFLVPDDFVSCP